MIKILFLIHDLGHGGAEKVLVNLVNNMDKKKFDITVMAIFGGGINEQFLNRDITYKTVFSHCIPGNSKLMKIFTPQQLHRQYIKDNYDIEVAYLEGPAARIISGCPNKKTKLIYWIHCTIKSEQEFAASFRTVKEAKECYEKFQGNVFVSREVMQAFKTYCTVKNGVVLYNTNESNKIIEYSKEMLDENEFREEEFRIIGVGKIEPVKGFARLARIHKRLITEGFPVHTYILGEGSQKAEIVSYLTQENLLNTFSFLGYQINPYKYIAKSNLFVCSSYSEGFSTATTESLIVGTPVVTTCVSGMKEMLGENNEYGIIVDNDEEALYQEIKKLICDIELLRKYKQKAYQRGISFSLTETVKAVEEFFLNLIET